MRVRISYSVELDHVPTECERMLYDAAAELQELCADVSDICSLVHKKDVNPSITSELFYTARKKLANIDAVLADNHLIMQGYYGAMEAKKEAPEDVKEG